MRTKIVYKQDGFSPEYSGGGHYYLVNESNIVVDRKYCSSRAFANYDFTMPMSALDLLQKYNIDEVWSNGELVYKSDNPMVSKKVIEIFNKLVEAD